MPSNIIKYIRRVRVFPVVWQCIAVGMVLFSVVNTMFMPEWGLNCCGSTQSIIAPIYFFVNLTQIFELYLHLSTTYVIFIMIWLEKKRRRKKKKWAAFLVDKISMMYIRILFQWSMLMIRYLYDIFQIKSNIFYVNCLEPFSTI